MIYHNDFTLVLEDGEWDFLRFISPSSPSP